LKKSDGVKLGLIKFWGSKNTKRIPAKKAETMGVEEWLGKKKEGAVTAYDFHQFAAY